MRLTAVFLALAFVGCSGSKDDSASAKTTAANSGDEPAALGPKPEPCAGDCVVRVYDRGAPERSWRFAKNALGLASRPGMEGVVLDMLIARELQAREAQRLGLKVSKADANKQIEEGQVLVVGQTLPGKDIYFKDGVFDFDLLERAATQLGLRSVDELIEEQRVELLAKKAGDSIVGKLAITGEDVQKDFVDRNTTAMIEVVFYSTSDYLAPPSPEELAAFMRDHEAEVRARYDDETLLYTGVKRQVRVRHVFFARSTPGTGTADPAYRKAKKAAAELAAGTSFEDVAKKYSDDTRTRDRGGDLGWRTATSIGLGLAVVEGVKDLPIGKVSDIISAERGFHIVRLDAEREGDLTFEQVRDEIAEKLAGDRLARDRARAAADAAVAKIAAGTPADDLFAPPPQMPEHDIEAVLKQLEGQVSPEQIEQFRAQAEKQKGPAIRAARRGDEKRPKRQRETFVRAANTPDAPDREMLTALFGDMKVGEWRAFARPSGDVAVVGLIERSDADLSEFEANKDALTERLREMKRMEKLLGWLSKSCEAARDEPGALSVNKMFLETADDEGHSHAVDYTPCAALRPE